MNLIKAIILNLVCCSWLFAQVLVQSANPPNIKWMQIENENTTIIFPKGLKGQAERFAAVVDYIDKNKKGTIGPKVTKIPIVIHGLSLEPNGFVSTVPFRSEIYTAPIPNWNILGQNDWLDVLAIHEYRHVLQNSNADVGISKLARIITGRAGWSAVLRFTDPSWFGEGDAVVSESLLSEGGRGRLPSFTEEMRAIFFADKHYRYNKSRNDSYKTQMPNHYPFGYILNLYARENFGDEVWSKVIHDANFFKSPFFPFSGAIKRQTGLKAKQLYKAAYKDFEEKTNEELEGLTLSPLENITEPNKKKISYYSYPFVRNNNYLIARKSSFSITPKLVKIDEDGQERTLTHLGISNNAFVSYADKGAIWIENQSNPRWENVDAARVMYYDFNFKTKRVLIEKDRFYYAAISPKEDKFITIKLTTDLVYLLSEYGLQNGIETSTFKNPENWDLAYPMYDNKEANLLYYIARKNGKLAIIKHDLDKDVQMLLTDWLNETMVELTQSETEIFFRASFSGIDNIYSVSKAGNKTIQQATSVPVSAGYPFYNQGTNELLFSNLTNTGTHLTSTVLDPENDEIFNLDSFKIYEELDGLNENGNILNKIPDRAYEETPYKGFLRGWKFHSWGLLPSFGSSDEGAYLPSLASANVFLNMDDILGANGLILNYTRYFNEDENAYGIDYTMGKYFAKLNLGYEYRGRKVAASKGNRILEFDEQEALVGLSVPLEIISGNYTWNTNLEANWKGIQQLKAKEFFEFDISKFGLYELKGAVSVNRRKAYQNLQSRFGGGLSIRYAESFQDNIAKIFRTEASLLLPGIGQNHGLEIQQGYYDESDDNLYRFPNSFSLGRGHNIFGIQNAYRTTVNYKMPLFYPDFGINGITYIKRVRMNLYFDTTHAKDSVGETDLRTAGAEFRFDQTFMNLFDLPIGFRVGYRFDNKFLPNLNPVYVNLIIGN
jgi:hypothetical protein